MDGASDLIIEDGGGEGNLAPASNAQEDSAAAMHADTQDTRDARREIPVVETSAGSGEDIPDAEVTHEEVGGVAVAPDDMIPGGSGEDRPDAEVTHEEVGGVAVAPDDVIPGGISPVSQEKTELQIEMELYEKAVEEDSLLVKAKEGTTHLKEEEKEEEEEEGKEEGDSTKDSKSELEEGNSPKDSKSRRGRKKGRMKEEENKGWTEEEEDFCFRCYDGGDLVLCDKRNCPKAYHAECLTSDPNTDFTHKQLHCDWHFCRECGKDAKFHCCMCINALCTPCFKTSGFLKMRVHGSSWRGFCNDCLPVVLMIERRETVTADGKEVDFYDDETFEAYYREYWEGVRVKENIALQDIEKVTAESKENRHAVANDVEDRGKGIPGEKNDAGQVEGAPLRSEGWASKELIAFLREHGGPLNLSRPVSRWTITGVLWKYIKKHNLQDPSNKSQVLCDDVFKQLFGGRTSVGTFSMNKFLAEHFPKKKKHVEEDDSGLSPSAKKANAEKLGRKRLRKAVEMEHEDEDEGDFQPDVESSEEEEDEDEDWRRRVVRSKEEVKQEQKERVKDRRRMSSSGGYRPRRETDGGRREKHDGGERREEKRHRGGKREDLNRPDPQEYAAINMNNIKLVYLKRSMLHQLYESSDFEEKVTGMIVRTLEKTVYRLILVTGVVPAPAYTISTIDNGRQVDKVLQVNNLGNKQTVKLTEISNDDFTQDEVKRLRQSMRVKLLPPLKVSDIERKAQVLNEINFHQNLELLRQKYENLKDRASDMGKRKELRVCVQNLKQLDDPEWRREQLEQLPLVETDPRMELEGESEDDDEREMGGGTVHNSPRMTGWDVKDSRLLGETSTLADDRFGDTPTDGWAGGSAPGDSRQGLGNARIGGLRPGWNSGGSGHASGLTTWDRKTPRAHDTGMGNSQWDSGHPSGGLHQEKVVGASQGGFAGVGVQRNGRGSFDGHGALQLEKSDSSRDGRGGKAEGRMFDALFGVSNNGIAGQAATYEETQKEARGSAKFGQGVGGPVPVGTSNVGGLDSWRNNEGQWDGRRPSDGLRHGGRLGGGYHDQGGGQERGRESGWQQGGPEVRESSRREDRYGEGQRFGYGKGYGNGEQSSGRGNIQYESVVAPVFMDVDKPVSNFQSQVGAAFMQAQASPPPPPPPPPPPAPPTLGDTAEIWMYRGADGDVYGPYSFEKLFEWRDLFPDVNSLRIWRNGFEKEDDGTFLGDAIRMCEGR